VLLSLSGQCLKNPIDKITLGGIFSYPLSNSVNSTIYVLRYPDIHIDSKQCSVMLSDSLLKTKYKYIATDSTAPLVTNCVTAVRYFLEKVSEKKLPPVFIGDMLRILATLCGCILKK
jgi:hypothetical protein